MDGNKTYYQYPEAQMSHLGNFIAGLCMFVLSLIIMYSGEFFDVEKGSDLESLFLFVGGICSISMSLSRNLVVSLAGNVCLCAFSAVLGLFSIFVQLFDMALWWEPYFYFNSGDLFFHVLLAAVFLYLSFQSARDIMAEGRKYSR